MMISGSMLLRTAARACGASARAFASDATAEGQTRVACLRDVRGVLQLSGPGVLHFIQGLITNDANKLEPPGAPPLAGCILTPQGRYAHDMLFHRGEGGEPSLLVDTDRRGKEDLISLLKRYRMHQRQIKIQDMSDRYSVWVQFDSSGAPLAASGAWRQDPRLPQLGLRTILPNSGAGPSGAAQEVPWREYRRWRILQGVAEGDSEIPSGSAVPAEYNLDALNAVSFDKGCYVGQEFVARIHFKGVVRKRLMPFSISPGAAAACCLSTGTAVCDVYDAAGALEAVGSVRVCEGDVGLAHLKLSAGLLAAQTGEPLYVRCGAGGAGGSYARILPWRPSWWPEEWGHSAQEMGQVEESASAVA